jgi:hypothetical protein
VSANVDFTNVNCFGGSNGQIVVSSISGGEGSPYYVKLNSGGTYQLTTTTRTYSNLTPGNYVVYVSDFNNNVTTYNVTITQPTQQSASITVNTLTTCGNFNDGVITIGSTGGTWPKTYRLYADTTSPYNSCVGGDLINTWSNIGAGSPTVVVSNLYAYGYCLEVTDANGCITNSGVVETTGCIGTCYEITIPVSSTSNNGENLYIEYRKTDNVYVSQPYFNFPQGSTGNDIIINICSTIGVSFRYGVSGLQFTSEGFITTTIGGKCDNSQWCGGDDPYIPPPPPPPTQPPSGSYYCKDGEYGFCQEQASPCGAGQISCTPLEQI